MVSSRVFAILSSAFENAIGGNQASVKGILALKVADTLAATAAVCDDDGEDGDDGNEGKEAEEVEETKQIDLPLPSPPPAVSGEVSISASAKTRFSAEPLPLKGSFQSVL